MSETTGLSPLGESKSNEEDQPYVDLTEPLSQLAEGHDIDIFDLYARDIDDDTLYREYVERASDKQALSRELYDKFEEYKISHRRKKVLERVHHDVSWYIGESKSIEDFEQRVERSLLIRNNFIKHTRKNYDSDYQTKTAFKSLKTVTFYRNFIDGGVKAVDKSDLDPEILGAECLAIIDRNVKKRARSEWGYYSSAMQSGVLGGINRHIYDLLGFNRTDISTEQDSFRAYGVESWQDFVKSHPDLQLTRSALFLASILDSEKRNNKSFITGLVDIPFIAPVGLNVNTFKSIEEDLIAIDRDEFPKGVTKIIIAGVQTFENVLTKITEALSKETPSEVQKNYFANAIKRKIDEAKKEGTLSFADIIKIANIITAPVRQMSGEKSIHELDPRELRHTSSAIDRIAYFVINDPNRPRADEANEEVWEVAFRCASLLVEIGTDRKLEQRVTTLGDLAIKLSMGKKLSKQEIRALSGDVKPARQQSLAEAVYGALKARRRSARYGLQKSGKGLIS